MARSTPTAAFSQTPQSVSTANADPKTLYPGKADFLVAELPYKGKELSMVVIVPQDAGGLGALEEKLTSANLQDLARQTRRPGGERPNAEVQTGDGLSENGRHPESDGDGAGVQAADPALRSLTACAPVPIRC